jgi:site-specific DNA-methyltransferase (adenine-specific)
MIKSELILGDCVSELKKIESNSIDCLITDPPYGTNDEYGKLIKRGNKHTSFNVIEWDTKLPTDFLEEVHRVLRDDTWGFIFVDKKEVTTMWKAIESYGLKPRNTFYWIKNNKAPTPRKNFKSSIEVAIVFTKGRTNIKWNGGANQNNYIIMPFVMGKEKVNHPTQKPVKLISHFIELVTNPDDIVLDPYMGSGTTAVAAKLLNRRYIGIELETEYYDIANKRIDSIKNPKPHLFF